jgi:hypothetical protein
MQNQHVDAGVHLAYEKTYTTIVSSLFEWLLNISTMAKAT